MTEPAKAERKSDYGPKVSAAPFNLAWIVFFVLLIFSPDTLDDIWNWVGDLATVWEILVWIFTFPYMLALAVWESGWSEWLRIGVVILIALIWSAMFNAPKPQRSTS